MVTPIDFLQDNFYCHLEDHRTYMNVVVALLVRSLLLAYLMVALIKVPYDIHGSSTLVYKRQFSRG